MDLRPIKRAFSSYCYLLLSFQYFGPDIASPCLLPAEISHISFLISSPGNDNTEVGVICIGWNYTYFDIADIILSITFSSCSLSSSNNNVPMLSLPMHKIEFWLVNSIRYESYCLALANSIASFPDKCSMENSIMHKSFHSFSISALRPVSLSAG